MVISSDDIIEDCVAFGKYRARWMAMALTSGRTCNETKRHITTIGCQLLLLDADIQ